MSRVPAAVSGKSGAAGSPRPATRPARASAIRIVLHTGAEGDAVRAFNERMLAGHAPTDFVLPDRPNTAAAADPDASIRWVKHLALDETGEVRGGFLLMQQPGWLNGSEVPVANYQSPVSEGILDKRYGMVGMHMLRHLEREHPLAFVVGMGGRDRPLPRLLSAAGWQIREVPFLFRIVRPSRVFRQLRPLQARPWLRRAAGWAAGSGAAWLATQVLHARGTLPLGQVWLQATPVARWGDWADSLWERVRDSLSFAVVRDRRTLERLYPLEGGQYSVFTFARGGEVAGFAVCAVAAMRDHDYFGNLHVATVLDVVGVPRSAGALVAALVRALAGRADLIVTNQSHQVWAGAFRRAGFASTRSNYLLATSRRLTERIGAAGGRVHVTRGDGDGRIHLVQS